MKNIVFVVFMYFMNISYEQEFQRRLAVAAETNVPICGSVGRSAILGYDNIPVLRPNGSYRDIDVVNSGQHSATAEQLPQNGEFDLTWLSPFVSEINGTHELTYPGTYVGLQKVPPKVRVPVPHLTELLEPQGFKNVNGRQPCLILRSDAQLALDSMRGKSHPKNVDMMRRLASLVAQLPVRERLDPALLEPFEIFGKEIDHLMSRRIYCAARSAYSNILPRRISLSLQPAVAKAARISGLI